MTSFNDPNLDVYFSYIDMKTEQLADAEAEIAPLQESMAEQNKIVAEEATKTTKQAWKRNAVATGPKVESMISLQAKAKIHELEAKLVPLELKASKIRAFLEDLQKTLEENIEFSVWSENLKLPRAERADLPKPARILRQEKREAEEREESMAEGEWVSLTLDHRSPKGKAAREAFYVNMNAPDEFGVVIDTPTEKPVAQETVVEIPVHIPEGPKYKSKLPWWYAKYNVPLTP